MSLTEQEIRRYSRHIILPEVGGRGQLKLKTATVVIAGLQAVGSVAALYLAAAGVGRLRLWDPGVVTEADLAAAIAHDRSRVGMPRGESAAVALRAINPAIDVEVLFGETVPQAAWPSASGAVATMGDWHVMAARAAEAGVPLVLAGILGASGAVTLVQPGAEGWSGRVIPESGEGMIVAAAAGVIGGVAATEALKVLLGTGATLEGRTLRYDGWKGTCLID